MNIGLVATLGTFPQGGDRMWQQQTVRETLCSAVCLGLSKEKLKLKIKKIPYFELSFFYCFCVWWVASRE